MAVPNGFHTLKQVQELPSNALRGRKVVNVIGLVKGFEPPKETFGPDWICTIELIDHSIKRESIGLSLVMFWPSSSMPKDPAAADAVVILQAKANMYRGNPTLLASKNTVLYFLEPKNNSRKSSTGSRNNSSWKAYTYNSRPDSLIKPDLTQDQITYALSMRGKRKEFTTIPSDDEFASRMIRSSNALAKFGLVKDFEVDKFYDVIGEVIRIWPSDMGWVSIYLSDYTANSLLFNYVAENTRFEEDNCVEDEYLHNSLFRNKNKWPGPYGKLTIQITLWDLNAEFARNEVEPGQWLLLKNVCMKFGRQSNVLEGQLHGSSKIHVKVLDQSINSSEVLSLLSQGRERREKWWNSHKNRQAVSKQKQLKNAELGQKGKHGGNGDGDGDSPRTRKRKRRNEERLEVERKRARFNAEQQARLDLNQNVQDSFPDQAIVSVKDILAPCLLSHSGPEKIYAPFTNRRYRANVRVIDYFPNEIVDFAIRSQVNETDISLNDKDPEANYTAIKDKWEWRFALLLEDASLNSSNKERVWVFVGHQAAQHLLNLEEDATDLRENTYFLAKVKEQLFKLWGDLEEHKSAARHDNRRLGNGSPSFDQSAGPEVFLSSPGHQPDPDSDIEKQRYQDKTRKNALDTVPAEQVPLNTELIDSLNQSIDNKQPTKNAPFSNKPFISCIQQYGVKLPEENTANANAGPHERWQRLFGLFGTQIK